MVELSRNERQLDAVFAALADHSRRQMLVKLRQRPLSISELAEPFAMSFAGVAKHIEVLSHAGLIKKIRAPDDRRSFRLELRREAVDEATQWLTYHRQFWASKLDQLEHFIEEEKHGKHSIKTRKKNKG